MTHEEFLKDITARANGLNVISYSDFYKLLKIIEKLREQRDSWILGRDCEWTALTSSLREQANKELDEIVVFK